MQDTYINPPLDQRAGGIRMHSGRIVFPLHLKSDQVLITDIAHHLSHICRFAGATDSFYSVAEHSVRVLRYVGRNRFLYIRRWALMHDAAEAYLGDVPASYKDRVYFRMDCQTKDERFRTETYYATFRTVERMVMDEIKKAVGMEGSKPDLVEQADLVLRATERESLSNGLNGVELEPLAADLPDPLTTTIRPWGIVKAKSEFLKEAENLGLYKKADD